MQDLQAVTDEVHYENYRSEKLQLKKFIDQNEKQKKIIQEKDNEVNASACIFFYLSFNDLFQFRRMQDMLAKMQGQLADQKPQLIKP